MGVIFKDIHSGKKIPNAKCKCRNTTKGQSGGTHLVLDIVCMK